MPVKSDCNAVHLSQKLIDNLVNNDKEGSYYPMIFRAMSAVAFASLA